MTTKAVTAEQRALLAGAVGRQGEALASALIAHRRYRDVAVLVEQNIAPAINGMSVFRRDLIPAARDLYIVLGTDSFSTRRSSNGRDVPFVQMDEHNTLAMATGAVAAGVQRIVLLSSSPSWQQFGALHTGLNTDLEHGLSRLPVKRLAVLRPLRESSAAGSGFVQRVVHAYLSIQMLMMPRSIPVLTTSTIASAAIISANLSDGQGVAVYSAPAIGRLLDPNASG